METKWQEVDLSFTFPEKYDAADNWHNEVTGAVGGNTSCTELSLQRRIDKCELATLAKFFLAASLNSRDLSIGQVIFTPAHTLQHYNTMGKPFYVHEGITPDGEYKYEFETHFKLK